MMVDKYAVIGNPIHHSLSPQIHREFALQTSQNIEYSAIEVPLDGLQASLQQLHDVLQLKGLNVTVPFKEQVWQLAKEKSHRAEQAGAVNTVVFKPDGSMFGDNTDGVGLFNDLTINQAIELADKRILLLGAGGASRGVIAPMLAWQPKQLFIANRTASKATALAKRFLELGKVQGGGYEEITGNFDLIINATAASLNDEVPPIPVSALHTNTACYDMMYSKTDTAFICWAKQHGVQKTMEGLGMLVEQAAEAFFIWRGVRPSTQPVIEKMRKSTDN